MYNLEEISTKREIQREMTGMRSNKIKKIIGCALISALVFASYGCTGTSSGGNMKMSKSTVSFTDEKVVKAKKTNPYGTGELSESDEFMTSNEKMLDAQIALFKNLADEEKNSMISPISILTAMSMVENGAKGNTLKEMEEVFGLSNEEMTKWITAWSSAFTGSKDIKVNLANSIWFKTGGEGQNSFEPEKAYIDVLGEAFGARAYGSDFSQNTVDDINGWCDKQTFGMIDKIIDKIDPMEVAILLNAIAFDGKWKEEYKSDMVHQETFTNENGDKEDVNMMYSTEKTYIQDELATGFVKPYSEKYSYVAILPNEGVSVSHYISKMDGKNFASLLDNQEPAIVHSVLPSYKSEYFRDDLKDVLCQMGIKDAFDPSAADFTGMGKATSGSLSIGDVIHKTFIEVNEKGTKAAAVTKIGMKAMSMAPPEMEYTVRLDRPFIYAIVDDATGTPIFIGTVLSVGQTN